MSCIVRQLQLRLHSGWRVYLPAERCRHKDHSTLVPKSLSEQNKFGGSLEVGATAWEHARLSTAATSSRLVLHCRPSRSASQLAVLALRPVAAVTVMLGQPSADVNDGTPQASLHLPDGSAEGARSPRRCRD